MRRLIIYGIVTILVASTFFGGYLRYADDDNDNDDNGGNGPIIPPPENESFVKDVTGPWVHDDGDDQILIGAYTNENGELLHIYHEPENSIYSYNNDTGEKKAVFSDVEIREWDLFGKDLFVYNSHEGTPGPVSPSHIHDLTHINLGNGTIETMESHALYGPDRQKDQFMIVGSTGPFDDTDVPAIVYFRDPDNGAANDEPMTWDLRWQSMDGHYEFIKSNVRIDEVMVGDAVSKNLTGFINQDGNFTLYKINPDTEDFEEVLELNNVQDFCLRENLFAVIQDGEVYTGTEDDPDGRTRVDGTEGAIEVDIYRNFLSVQKDDGLWMFKKGHDPYKIFDEKQMNNIWLEPLLEDLLIAAGDLHANAQDTAHMTVELN